jgi:hypothetical protein
MVFRAEAREAQHPIDCFGVYAIDRGGPAVAVFSAMTNDAPAMLAVYRYPDGTRVETLTGADALQLQVELAPTSIRAAERFDFDADGAFDTIEVGQGVDFGTVRVRSGADQRVIFENDDPLEYECRARAIPLSDIDGDGYSELALLHPRTDRSRYDIEPIDWIFGAKSWVTIVSGARIER